jgi:hypothetical protein
MVKPIRSFSYINSAKQAFKDDIYRIKGTWQRGGFSVVFAEIGTA